MTKTQFKGRNYKGTPMSVDAIKKELQYFEKIKADLLKTNKGQFALIKGEELLGTFSTMEEAYKQGVDRFGVEPFLIKQIVEIEEKQKIPALTSYLIHANL